MWFADHRVSRMGQEEGAPHWASRTFRAHWYIASTLVCTLEAKYNAIIRSYALRPNDVSEQPQQCLPAKCGYHGVDSHWLFDVIFQWYSALSRLLAALHPFCGEGRSRSTEVISGSKLNY